MKTSKSKAIKGSERFLGVDYGKVNIGLAFGTAGLTMPLKIISAVDRDRAISDIARLALENKISKIVVGLPVTPDGKLTMEALEVKQFVREMNARIKIPTVFTDESLTTKDALDKALGIGFSKKRRSKIDHLAAELILRRFFAENKSV